MQKRTTENNEERTQTFTDKEEKSKMLSCVNISIATQTHADTLAHKHVHIDTHNNVYRLKNLQTEIREETPFILWHTLPLLTASTRRNYCLSCLF